MTRESAYWYWLATSRMDHEKADMLIQTYGSLEKVFADPSLLNKTDMPIKKASVSLLKKRADKQLLNSEIKKLFESRTGVVTLADDAYPPLLRQIADPPLMMYTRGSLSRLSDQRIAVVGTRACTRAGYENTRKLCRELSENGVSIISGMARGIDTAALEGALEGGTACAAVLGSGVDIPYPKENEGLYHAIMQAGVVLSEYAPGTPPYRGNFPKRNRIISGMCPGVLIAHAPIKSGSAITMRLAAEENRDVFAVPGNINEEGSALPNLLITEGAVPVTGAEAILSFYGWVHEKKMNFEKIDPPALDFYEQQLYTLLKQGEWNMDELAREADMDISAVSLSLTMLELKGIVTRLPGNVFGLTL